MKISQASGYALHALMYMARHVTQLPVTSRAMAKAEGMPPGYLAKVLQRLAKAGFVKSVQGRKRGYIFAVPPEEISLFALFESLEERSLFDECPLQHFACGGTSNNCHIYAQWLAVIGKFKELLRETTVAVAAWHHPEHRFDKITRKKENSREFSPTGMDDLDRRILDALQHDFPLTARPFDVLAQRLEIDAELLWGRVDAMLEQGIIRRLGASFDSRKLGFCSTLAAVRVESGLVESAARTIGRYPEVTHSYLRDHEFNIWFTVIATEERKIEAILREIRAELSLDAADILNLPMKRAFKLDARFKAWP